VDFDIRLFCKFMLDEERLYQFTMISLQLDALSRFGIHYYRSVAGEILLEHQDKLMESTDRQFLQF